MNRFRLSILLIATLFNLCVRAAASPTPIPHGTVELISDQKAIQASSSFTLGLRFKLESGWHIYWINPGDSGQPPRVRWDAPTGIEVGEIQWPVPKRLPVGPLMDYGYEEEVLLPISARTTPELTGSRANVQGLLRVLVCRETCIPGKAELLLPLEIKTRATSSNEAPAFKNVLEQLPQPLPGNWRIQAADRGTEMSLTISGLPTQEKIEFFPATPNVIENAASQKLEWQQYGIAILTLTKAAGATSVSELSGLLLAGNPARGYSFTTPLSADLSARATPVNSSPPGQTLAMLLFAFVGGLILNLMPCVFPVLSIKVLSILGSHDEQYNPKLSALIYTLGIVVSFWALVAVLLFLRSAGGHLGWGFQLQSPAFVTVLICILFLFGLNLAGVFEIGQSLMGAGGSLAGRKGYSGSFFTGVLAVVVATPCTAPFMGTAIAFALAQPAFICFAVFTSMALGLSLPFLVIALIPALARLLPKPGRWMETLKNVMSFLVFATVIWLLWVLGLQADVSSLVRILGALLVIAFAVWSFNRWSSSRVVTVLAILLVASTIFFSTRVVAMAPPVNSGKSLEATASGKLTWEPFSSSKLASYRSSRLPVLIDFTAAWCLTCQVNERVAFGAQSVQQRLKQGKIALLRADWTSNDPEITRTLNEYGRSGVPLYVLYGAGSSDPVFLPEGVFGPDAVLRELDRLKL